MTWPVGANLERDATGGRKLAAIAGPDPGLRSTRIITDTHSHSGIGTWGTGTLLLSSQEILIVK